MLRSTVSRPICLGVKHQSEAYDDIFVLPENCGLVDMGRSLWRQDGSVVYNCCWLSPAQSFSGPRPVELATIFYSLKFETSLFVASYDSQGYGGGIRPRLQMGFTSNSKSKSDSKLCYDRRSVGQPVLVQSTHVLLETRSLFLPDSCRLVDMGLSLMRGRVCRQNSWCPGRNQVQHIPHPSHKSYRYTNLLVFVLEALFVWSIKRVNNGDTKISRKWSQHF
jgi:hypothetical protein